jgi:hypothetical protein
MYFIPCKLQVRLVGRVVEGELIKYLLDDANFCFSAKPLSLRLVIPLECMYLNYDVLVRIPELLAFEGGASIELLLALHLLDLDGGEGSWGTLPRVFKKIWCLDMLLLSLQCKLFLILHE